MAQFEDSSSEWMTGFRSLSRKERLQRLGEHCALDAKLVNVLANEELPPEHLAEHFIENSVGYFALPFGIATHFKIDGRVLPIPMAVEETSIIAAASATAKWVARQGHIRTWSEGRISIGQIQIPKVQNQERLKATLETNRADWIAAANRLLASLVSRGGGVRGLELRLLDRQDQQGTMGVFHLLVDCCDAMGANLINQACELLKPEIEAASGEHVGLCILSNLVDQRLACAEVYLEGVDTQWVEGIVEAGQFAQTDPYRAATHNKGVMNGVDAVMLATGNDWRAIEAGAHAYASRSGSYGPLTTWEGEGSTLRGRIEIPMAVGTVGGVTQLHPHAQFALQLMNVQHAEELGRIAAAVGLIQNLGALRALSTVGIVEGHMKLHAANLAIAAGAEENEVAHVRSKLADVLKKEKRISLAHAKAILEGLRKSRTHHEARFN